MLQIRDLTKIMMPVSLNSSSSLKANTYIRLDALKQRVTDNETEIRRSFTKPLGKFDHTRLRISQLTKSKYFLLIQKMAL